jgi:hypothetical protein
LRRFFNLVIIKKLKKMKNLISAFGFIAVLFAVSCSTNPVETPQYKALATGLDSLKNSYTTLMTEVGGMGASLDQMKSAVAGLAKPDSTLSAMVSAYEAGITSSAETMKKHQDMITAQGEKMKNHATMKMEDIVKDFDVMTTEFGTMMTELNGIKNMHMQSNQSFQTALAALQSAAAPVTGKK